MEWLVTNPDQAWTVAGRGLPALIALLGWGAGAAGEMARSDEGETVRWRRVALLAVAAPLVVVLGVIG